MKVSDVRAKAAEYSQSTPRPEVARAAAACIVGYLSGALDLAVDRTESAEKKASLTVKAADLGSRLASLCDLLTVEKTAGGVEGKINQSNHWKVSAGPLLAIIDDYQQITGKDL